MTTHYLFEGGLRTGNSLGPTDVFPATEPAVGDRMEMDWNRQNGVFTPTRVLDFNAGSLVQNASIPASLSPEAWATSAALRKYIRENRIANNDVIVTHILPKMSQLIGVHWAVQKAKAGTAFKLRLRGQAASIGGAIDLKTGISGAAVASGYIELQARATVTVDGSAQSDVATTPNPLYLNQNDALELVFTTLPANSLAADGSEAGGAFGLAVWVTPVIRTFIRGV